jgi:hypothetical protein
VGRRVDRPHDYRSDLLMMISNDWGPYLCGSAWNFMGISSSGFCSCLGAEIQLLLGVTCHYPPPCLEWFGSSLVSSATLNYGITVEALKLRAKPV